MRAKRGEESITCFADWALHAGPKSDDQWVEGRSAFELAHAWCETGAIAMPADLRRLFDSHPLTRGASPELIHPEHRISFDGHGGEPRNADLAFVAGSVAVTIEAKADEPFGDTVSGTLADALERSVVSRDSRGIERVRDLARSLFHPRAKGEPKVGSLRYQLLTAVAGSLAYARDEKAEAALLVVHEFVTPKTTDALHQKNAADFRSFLHRLGVPNWADGEGLLGPITVPGKPSLPLYVAKITTSRR